MRKLFRKRWQVVSIPDNGERPTVLEKFFFHHSALGFAAWYEIFHAELTEDIIVERV